MYASAGANPQAATGTEVMFGGAEEAAQAGPVGFGDGEVGGERVLAGLVEGLGGREETGHWVFFRKTVPQGSISN
jgi:hypothetical protein